MSIARLCHATPDAFPRARRAQSAAAFTFAKPSPDGVRLEQEDLVTEDRNLAEIREIRSWLNGDLTCD